MKAKKLIPLITALVIFISISTFATLNVSAATPCADSNCLQLQDPCTTPADYSCNDYQKLAAFAAQDYNLAKLGWDLTDPDSWGEYDDGYEKFGVFWNDSSPKRVERIYLWEMDLTGELDVSDFASLDSLSVSMNQLTSINASDCPALFYLSAQKNQLTTLNVSGSSALDSLGAYENQLTSIDLTGLTNLRELALSDNQLTSIDLAGLTNLSSLGLWDNQLQTLDVSDSIALQDLNVQNNKLTSINISGLTDLWGLKVENNRLTTLDVSSNTDLYNLEVSDNQLETLNLSNNTGLRNLKAGNNRLRELVLVLAPTSSEWLSEIDVSGNFLSDLSSLENFQWLAAVDVGLNILDLNNGAVQASIQKIGATIQANKQWQIDNWGTYPGIDDNYYLRYSPQKCLDCELYPCECCEICGFYPCVCIQPDQPPSHPIRMGRNPRNTNPPTAAYENGDVNGDGQITAAYEKGDVNGDGQITALDALLVLKHVSGKEILTGAALEAADINNDGIITAEDALTILKFVTGMIDEV